MLFHGFCMPMPRAALAGAVQSMVRQQAPYAASKTEQEAEARRHANRAAGGALRLLLDELSIYGLQRMAATLMAANALAAAEPCAASLGEAAELDVGALGDIVISNDCPVSLLVRQVGGRAAAEQLQPYSCR